MNLPKISNKVCREGKLRHERYDHSFNVTYVISSVQRAESSRVSQIGDKNELSYRESVFEMGKDRQIWLMAVEFLYKTDFGKVNFGP